MAKRDGPWVRFYASDWLAGTRGMTASETGVYITLIATMYERAEPIARDDARLARLCGLPTRNFSQILDRLIDEEKITLEGAKLWGRKVELEVRNRSARAEKSAMAARTKHEQNQRPKSANADAGQTPGSSQTVPRARVSEPDSEKERITNVIPKKAAPKGSRLPEDWMPSPSDAEWIRGKWPGISRAKVETEIEKFKNYWLAKSGKDATKINWSRTWQNWMISAMERVGSSSPTRVREPDVADLANDILRQMEQAENGNSETPDGDDRQNQQLLPSPQLRDG